jgi:predicted RNA-binding protein with PUA-like domain
VSEELVLNLFVVGFGQVFARAYGSRGSQVKSSYYSPQSKEQNPQQAEQGHAQIQQCVFTR